MKTNAIDHKQKKSRQKVKFLFIWNTSNDMQFCMAIQFAIRAIYTM